MPRYVIERTFDVDEDELPIVGQRARQVGHEQFPQIVWEHSHVVVDGDGTLKSFCVYEAPDEATIRRHGGIVGNHEINHIYEIGGDITPDDFPLSTEEPRLEAGFIADLDAVPADVEHVGGGGPTHAPGQLQ